VDEIIKRKIDQEKEKNDAVKYINKNSKRQMKDLK
jgi:hypothetical protein